MNIFPKKTRHLIEALIILHPLINSFLAAACYFCSLAKVEWMYLLVAVYWISVYIYWQTKARE